MPSLDSRASVDWLGVLGVYHLLLFLTPWPGVYPEGGSRASHVDGDQYHLVGQEALEERVIDEAYWLASVYHVVEGPPQRRRSVVPFQRGGGKGGKSSADPHGARRMN